jgi:hypothetical protein
MSSPPSPSPSPSPSPAFSTDTLSLAVSNIVMMVYRQAVFVISLVCLFFFRSPIRSSILGLRHAPTDTVTIAEEEEEEEEDL